MSLRPTDESGQTRHRVGGIEARPRRVVFDHDGQLASHMREIWAVLGEDADEFMRPAFEMVARHPNARAKLANREGVAHIDSSRKRIRHKFTEPLDEEWIAIVS